MKRLLLIVLPLLLIVGCSKEPINYETTLVERDGVYYTKDTNQPYSGPVFSLDEKGRNKRESNLEDGKMTSYKEFEWYENGKMSYLLTYKDGVFSGKGTYYHRDGTKIEPIIFDNKIIRKGDKEQEPPVWTFFNKDTNIPYSGRVLTIFENGKKQGEGTFKDGKLDGLHTYWYENGQIHNKLIFKDGELVDEKKWYENGQKKKEVIYEDGIDISYKEWNEDGSVNE